MTWWKEGVQFQCQGSGKCCVSRGEYGYVYLTDDDIKRFAAHFKLTRKQFTEIYCQKTDGLFHLKEESGQSECMFLKSNRCSVYKARPTQCRTWPFWPENMSAKSWKANVKSFCPGVDKGKSLPPSKISKLLAEQKKADKELGL